MAIISAVMTPMRRSSLKLRSKPNSIIASSLDNSLTVVKPSEPLLEKPEPTFRDDQPPKKQTPHKVEPSPVIAPKHDSFHSTPLKSLEPDFSATLCPLSENSEFPSISDAVLLAPVNCEEEPCSRGKVPVSQPEKTVAVKVPECAAEQWQWEGTAQSRYVFSKVS
ncbi:unnamed protein product [Dibothriocephalus latus]|uniref:Uncharacterized protein n=1 Tax=Dibothriocephalus latus TaxID=60516 RepID=A0A3P7LID0_DIBLA|nr:unnamed protein product [Dibothriocephalus latus]